MPVARSTARPSTAGAAASGNGIKPVEAFLREPLDAAYMPRPPTCPRCAGPLPVVQSAATVASGASIKPGEALDAPCRRAETYVRGAIGREALCRRGGEQRPLKPGEPGEALHRGAAMPATRPRPGAGLRSSSTPTATARSTITWSRTRSSIPTKDKRIAAGREI
jgi:hypothetical protein